jgi:hypothetical protein
MNHIGSVSKKYCLCKQIANKKRKGEKMQKYYILYF